MGRKKTTQREEQRDERAAWVLLTRRFLDHFEIASKRGVQSAKVALEQTGEMMYANQLAHWQGVQTSINWLRIHAVNWARKNII